MLDVRAQLCRAAAPAGAASHRQLGEKSRNPWAAALSSRDTQQQKAAMLIEGWVLCRNALLSTLRFVAALQRVSKMGQFQQENCTSHREASLLNS